MTITTQKSSETRWDIFKTRASRFFAWLFTVRKVGAGLLILSFVVGIVGYGTINGEFRLYDFLRDYYTNISTELGSVAIAVLIIDSLNDRRQRESEKERLIRQMRSGENGIALQAVEELRAIGAVKDGSLRKQNLESANLENVRLGRADMREARMDFCNMSKGHFYFADLHGADMSGVNLQEAVMTGANLRNVDLVAAHLEGALMSEVDLTHAKLEKAKMDERTQLPDKTNWFPGADLARFTDPHHPNYWRSDMQESPAFKRR
jgi:hypothetical protein